ncbi:Nn.00g056450.m01.CDS01 [Neocucurbitaria sp. VM-36]
MAPSHSVPSPSRQHSEDHTESWVEIGSRPSSSSLSSAADEIITTGLTVQHDSNLHRRHRRPRGGSQFQIGTGHRVTTTGGNSSQEEYEESESESDRVMSSSNEGIGPSPLRQEIDRPARSPQSLASSETMSEREEDDEDDDENATAVNYPRSTRREFQPRPNAFSHPNSQQPIRSQSGTVYTPRRNVRPTSQRQHSYPQHSPYNVVVPTYQADHDEALRASLSTLLSAAAAVRGLPKPGQPRTSGPSSARVDPTSLRLVPESVALGTVSEETASSSRTASSDPSDKSKRKASPPITAGARSSSKDRRAVKKARRSGPLIEEISPTLLTWVVSAGVVVLVSALSFSAGYVVGKEAGHAEVLGQISATGSEAGGCAKEAASGLKGTGLGLRKLRWTGGAGIRA